MSLKTSFSLLCNCLQNISGMTRITCNRNNFFLHYSWDYAQNYLIKGNLVSVPVKGQILNIKIENVTNIMTQLYNHSDIHNKAVEIKKTTLTKMSSTDNFISKKTTKYNYSIGRTFFLKEERTERPQNKMPRFQSEFNKKQDWNAFSCNDGSDVIGTLLGKEQ